MKSILMSMGVAALMALGGCDSNDNEFDPERVNQYDSSGVPEGGPESPPDETLYEGAVPESQEDAAGFDSGERADGDW